MDMLQLRSAAELMDKLTVIALILAALAIVAAGGTTWLSLTYHRALSSRQDSLAPTLQKEIATARERSAQLEKEIASARERLSELQKAAAEAGNNSIAADKHANELERTAEAARNQAAALEKELAEAKARNEGKRPEGDPSSPARNDGWRGPLVENLRKFASTKAAVYAIGEEPDAAETGALINSLLSEAGWASAMWKWMGVSGMVGVAIVTREGVDPEIDKAALATVAALREAGFNAAKASWPLEFDWRRVRGSLSGPPSVDPAEAPVRIVIGARSR
jgi:hypothetical protein